MVEFLEITEKSIRVNYTSEMGGYKVEGTATYNKEKTLTRATGSIRNGEEHVANFNTMGSKVNIVDCDTSLMSTVADIAEATIKELCESYPQE